MGIRGEYIIIIGHNFQGYRTLKPLVVDNPSPHCVYRFSGCEVCLHNKGKWLVDRLKIRFKINPAEIDECELRNS